MKSMDGINIFNSHKIDVCPNQVAKKGVKIPNWPWPNKKEQGREEKDDGA